MWGSGQRHVGSHLEGLTLSVYMLVGDSCGDLGCLLVPTQLRKPGLAATPGHGSGRWEKKPVETQVAGVCEYK